MFDYNLQADPSNSDHVTPYALNSLHAYADREGLEYEVYYKDEGYPGLYWKCLGLLAWLWGKLNPSFWKRFTTTVTNTSSKVILFPARATHQDHLQWNVYTTLRHELVHMRDAKRFPILFPLSYTFLPIPIGLAYCRANWEFRAYTQNMISAYNQYGYIWEGLIDHITNHFCGSLYFWMWPFRKTMRRKILAVAKAIEEGKVYGYYPDVNLWKY